MAPDDDDPAEPDDTPLPPPLAHHVADPTRGPDDFDPPTDADPLPLVPMDAASDAVPLDDSDVAGELPTRQIAKLDAGALAKIDAPPPTVPIDLVDLVERDARDARDRDTDTEDELTSPRDLPRGMLPRAPTAIEDASLFAALPADARAGILARFARRHAATGDVVIRQGESGHALIVVARGRLQVRCERADGQLVTLGYVRAGEFVGEGSLLARAPSPVQVVATEPTDVLALAPKDAYDVAGAYPAVWAELKDAAQRRTREWDALLARR